MAWALNVIAGAFLKGLVPYQSLAQATVLNEIGPACPVVL